MGVKDIDSFDEFKQIIKSGKPVVIDFWAEWCKPCKTIAPQFKDLSDTVEGVEFYKVDVDKQLEIAQEAGIAAMPTFVLFKDGEKLKVVRGVNPPALDSLVKEGASLICPDVDCGSP